MWFRSDFLWALTLICAALPGPYRARHGRAWTAQFYIKELHINAIIISLRIQIWSDHSSAEARVGEHHTQR